MNMVNTQVQTEAAGKLLDSARGALQAGNREMAYRLSLDAIRLDPDNIEAWLIRYSTAPSNEEKLLSLSQVVRLNPEHPIAKRNMYNTLGPQLQKDPYLSYVEENEKAYIVRSTDYQLLAVPKDRAVPETYPLKQPPLLSRAYHWLALAGLGLTAAGLGALLFAPLAIRDASDALDSPMDPPDRRRAWIILALSLLMVGAGLFLAWIFLAHIRG